MAVSYHVKTFFSRRLIPTVGLPDLPASPPVDLFDIPMETQVEDFISGTPGLEPVSPGLAVSSIVLPKTTFGRGALAIQATMGLLGVLNYTVPDILPPLPQNYGFKTANTSIVSSTVLVSDLQLVVPLQAGESWSVDFYIAYNAHATPDIKFSITAPAGSTGFWTIVPSTVAGGGFTDSLRQSFGAAQLSAGSGIGVSQIARIHAQVNTPVAGALQFQWAQNNSNANPSMVEAGSYFLAKHLT